MLDVKMVRANPDEVRKALQRRGDPTSSLDEFLAVEERRRQLLTEVESRRAERKRASDEIAAVKKAGGDADQAIAAMRALGDQIKEHEAALAETEERLNVMLLELPNIPLPDVPDGGEEDSVVLRTVGRAPREFDFAAQGPPRPGPRPRPHRHGARRQGERLALRLPQGRPGHAAVRPRQLRARRRPEQGLPPGGSLPVLVREQTMEEAGFFPTDRNQVYEGRRRRAVPRGHERDLAVDAASRRVLRGPTRCPPATPASRHAFGGKRERTAKTLEASSACTSSTRSRCSRGAPAG